VLRDPPFAAHTWPQNCHTSCRRSSRPGSARSKRHWTCADFGSRKVDERTDSTWGGAWWATRIFPPRRGTSCRHRGSLVCRWKTKNRATHGQSSVRGMCCDVFSFLRRSTVRVARGTNLAVARPLLPVGFSVLHTWTSPAGRGRCCCCSCWHRPSWRTSKNDGVPCAGMALLGPWTGKNGGG